MIELKNKTFWKVGGYCELFYEVGSTEELLYTLKNLKNNKVNYVVIGNGTNVLFDSEGFDDAVIKLGSAFNYIERISDDCIEVGSSTWVPHLVRFLSTEGLGGIEHCIGIPATIGGLVAMNGGSQRKSISENLLSVTYLSKDGIIKTIDKFDCDFKYRHSVFKNSGNIILSVKLKLDTIKKNENRKQLLSILKERRLKFPRKIPNCGSVFLSNPENYAKHGAPGFIIESLGLKGLRSGSAVISERHANFILNTDNALSSDILNLVKIINDACLDKLGFKLKAEAIFYKKNGMQYTLDEAADSINE